MADNKGSGPRPSSGSSDASCNKDNTPAHVLRKMGKPSPLDSTSGPKTRP